PNNIYASQWALGRMVMLLRDKNGDASISSMDPSPPGPPSSPFTDIWDTSKAKGGSTQDFIQRTGGGTLAPLVAPPSPYSSTGSASLSTKIAGTGTFMLQQSRYDLANTTLETFRSDLQAFIAGNPANTDWWSNLMLDCRFQCDPY